MRFEKFKPSKSSPYAEGWDKFALDYAELSTPGSVYYLTKKLMYEIINKNIELNENSCVLDVGCGTGNDFPFFLSQKTHITGFDMSDGMLNKAHEKYAEHIGSGKINLLKGQLEEFEQNSIQNEQYDLIYSVTGGLSYIDNAELERIFKLFKSLLKPGGKIITAHFNRVCLIESLYYLLRLKFNLVNQRNTEQLQVNIKNKKMTMYLRSIKDLEKISSEFKHIKSYPLLAITPPYQTGYTPGKTLLILHKILEHGLLNSSAMAKIADQIVLVFSND